MRHIRLPRGTGVDILRVLAGFQGMLLIDQIEPEMLKGSWLTELGIDRMSRDAPNALAGVIDTLIEALRDAGV